MNGSGYSQRRPTNSISAANSNVNSSSIAVGNSNAPQHYFGNIGSAGNSSSTLSSGSMPNMAGNQGISSGNSSNANYFLSSSAVRRSSRHATGLGSSAGTGASTSDPNIGANAATGGSVLTDGGAASSLDLNDPSISGGGWGYTYQQSSLPPPPPAPPQSYYGGSSSSNVLPSQSSPGSGSGFSVGHTHSHGHTHGHHSHPAHSHSHGHGHTHGHYQTHHHHSSTPVSGTTLGIGGTTGASTGYNSTDASYFSNTPQQMITRSTAAGMAAHQSPSLASHHGAGSLGSGAGAYGSSSSLSAVDDFGFGGGGPGGMSGGYSGYAADPHLSSSYVMSGAKRKKSGYSSKEPKREHYDEDRMTEGGDDKKPKQRATKACDKCREQKCKCVPDPDHPSTCAQCFLLGVSCTYRGPSHKRGPPKGYLSAVINRLEAMEDVILSKLSRNTDDPRARALLHELIGDAALSQVLSGRLKFGDRKEASAADGLSYTSSSSAVKKGSGPNGTTWQDTWWVATPGVPSSHTGKMSANRTLASRFPTAGGPSIDTSSGLSTRSGGMLASASSEFQPNEELSPKSIERPLAPETTAGSSALQGSLPLDWQASQQQQQLPQQQYHYQADHHSNARGDTRTTDTATLPSSLPENGHDLASFWKSIARSRLSSDNVDRHPVEVSMLLVTSAAIEDQSLTMRLQQGEHSELAKLTRAVQALDISTGQSATEYALDVDTAVSPSARERPTIKGNVCYLVSTCGPSELSNAAADVSTGARSPDDRSIAQYLASDLHWTFPIVHCRYYRTMKGKRERGEEVIGLTALEDAMTMCVKTMGNQGPTWPHDIMYQQASGTQAISIFTAAASLLLAYRAFRDVRLVESAGQLSLAVVWAQQLGLHRLGPLPSVASTNGSLIIEEQHHAGLLVWSGCAVLNHFLEVAGVTSPLYLHRPLYSAPPFLSSQADTLRAAFDPAADPETAITALTNLAGLHTLAYIMSEAAEHVSKMRSSSQETDSALFALERRVARWPGLVDATLLSTLQGCDVSASQPESRVSANRECLSATAVLLEKQAMLMINEKVVGWSLQRQISSAKAATAIADHASSFANALDDAVKKVMMQPWCVTALFSAGVQQITGMTRTQRSQEMEDLREELEVVRLTLQGRGKECELAIHYDDILKSVPLPRGPLGRAATTSSYGDGDMSATGGSGSGQGGGDPDANAGGMGTGYNMGYGAQHRGNTTGSSTNPFYQSNTYSATTGVSNATADRNATRLYSQREAQSFAPVPPSSDMDLDERMPSPETPTPNPTGVADQSYSLRAGQVSYGLSIDRSDASPSILRSQSRHDIELERQQTQAHRHQYQQESGHVRFHDYPVSGSGSAAMPTQPSSVLGTHEPARSQYERRSAWGSANQGELSASRNDLSIHGDVAAENSHYTASATLSSSPFEGLLTTGQSSSSVRSTHGRAAHREQTQQFSFELPSTTGVNLLDSTTPLDASSRRPVTAGRSEQSAEQGYRHGQKPRLSPSRGKNLRPSTSADRAISPVMNVRSALPSYEPSTTLTASAPSLEIFADVAANVTSANLAATSKSPSPAELNSVSGISVTAVARVSSVKAETGLADYNGDNQDGQIESGNSQVSEGTPSHESTERSSMSTLREALGYPTPKGSASASTNAAASSSPANIYPDPSTSTASHINTSGTVFSSSATAPTTGSDLFKVEHAPRGVLHL